MPYVVTNTYTTLKLKISTKLDSTLAEHLELTVHYRRDGDSGYSRSFVAHPTETETGSDVVFNIQTKYFEIDDVLYKFDISMDTDIPLWETNEGIIWLLDDEESDPVYDNTKTFNFTESGNHTIEAVFVGNDKYKMGSTGKYSIIVNQPETDEEGSLANNGAYNVSFVNKNLSSMTYMDGTKIEFILKKGGVPVVTNPPRNIEVIVPTGIASKNLDNNGKTKVYNNNPKWNAGTYTIGAFYQDEREGRQHIVTRKTKKITIKKGTPVFSDNSASVGNFVPKSKYKLVLKFNGSALANTKISLYVNNKLNTLTTDKKGAVYYSFPKTGTYVLKAVFKGNKNLKKIEQMKTITVVKANG